MTATLPDYLWACAFGAVAAVGELLSRYRDAPWRAVRQLPGVLYLVVNALSGVFGLWVVYLLNLKFGLTEEDAIRWVRVLADGCSSLAILRSSVFVVKAGDKDIPIGPAAALQAILTSLDRAVDRANAARRARFVADVLPPNLRLEAKRLRFLTSYSLGLMQNVSADEQKQVRLLIDGVLADTKLTLHEKLVLVCLQLLPFIGFDLMATAVEQVRTERPGTDDDQEAPPVADLLTAPPSPSAAPRG